MPVTIDNETYLSTPEARSHLKASSYVFEKRKKQYHLKAYTLEGKGQALYYRLSDWKRYQIHG